MNLRLRSLGPWLPLIGAASYLLLTYAIFVWGPLHWKIHEPATMHRYAALCLLFMVGGYIVGVRKLPVRAGSLPWRPIFWVGGIASLLLLTPATWLNTHKWPWEAFEVFGCPSYAYLDMLRILDTDQFSSQIYHFVAMLCAPFTFAVIPLGILHARDLRKREWLLLAAHIAGIMSFSILRGTDKETFDLMIMMIALMLIVFHQIFFNQTKKPRRFFIACGIMLIVICLTVGMFFARKEARMSENCPACGCDIEKDTRFRNLVSIRAVFPAKFLQNTPLANDKINPNRFYWEIASSYLGQGYLGMSLALDKDFTSCFGLGHSPLLMSVVGAAIGDDFNQCSYIIKIEEEGWSSTAYWSTAVVWIANDVGFVGALAVLALFGVLLAASWKSAIAGQNAGFLLFSQLLLGMFYIPANTQLFMTPESYAAFLFWLGYWIVLQYRPSHQ